MTVKDRPKVARGSDMVAKFHESHPRDKACFVCGKDCGRSALVGLVYTFEECRCDKAPYTHLIERLWHRKCFSESADAR